METKSNNRRVFSRFVSITLCLSMLITNFVIGDLSAAATGVVSNINVWNVKDGTFLKTDEGYKLSDGGDNFAISDKCYTTFTLKSDIKFIDGKNVASLIYGLRNVQNQDGWRGIQFCKKSDTTGTLKVFNTKGSDIITERDVEDVDWTQPISVKAEMNAEKLLTVSINNNVIASGTDSTYNFGYVGLLTWDSSAYFNNIDYTGEKPTGNATSDITNWTSAGNNLFTEMNDGSGYRVDGNNDCFAISDKKVNSFTYEADIKMNESHIGGSDAGVCIATLTYGNSRTNNSGKLWRGIELKKVDDSTAKIKAFIFDSSNNIPETVVNDVDWTGYNHVKAVMDENNKLTVYFNDVKIGEGTDANYAGGYLGLLTYSTSASFNNIKYTGSQNDFEAYSDLSGWICDGGTITETANGLYMPKGRGNSFAISSTQAKEFTYEAEYSFVEGENAATLVYGVNNPYFYGSWRGVELKKLDDTKGKIKAFAEGVGSIINDTEIPNLDFTVPVRMRITMNSEKKLTVYVNNKEIASGTDATYNNGYIGLLTWNTGNIFNNIKFASSPIAGAGGLNTSLSLYPTWDKNGGEWSETADGLKINSNGDAFILSKTNVSDFVYEGDVSWPASTDGAISLMFRATDNYKGYIANIDRGQKNARIFRFNTDGSVTTVASTTLTNAVIGQTSFKIRIEAIGTTLRYFIDGNLVITCQDSAFMSGRLGILAYKNNNVVYQNLNHVSLNSENTPHLAGLEINGVSVSPKFNSANVSYTAVIPYSQQTTKVKLTAGVNTNKLSIMAKKADSTVIMEKTAVNSAVESQDIALSVGDNIIYCYAKGANGAEITTSVVVTREQDPQTMYTEKYRPQFHFTTIKNWINDPNGLVYDNGVYHMFYQYNPYGLNIANQVWGHATSTDLVKWKEQPIAIPQDELGAVFSGSAVVDTDNTTGFFTDNEQGESKLVAIYTSDGGDTTHGVEKQCIAYSKDNGLTWTKYQGNPVIPNDNNVYGRDFRDPKVFRHDGKWFMIIAGGRARLFSSANLINWTLESELVQKNGQSLNSECPDLFPLAVDGNKDNIKWVYTGSGKFYIIGDLIKNATTQKYEFKAESDNIAPYNGAGEMYATQSYYNTGDRRMLVSWMQDSTASQLSSDGKVWNGVQSLPLVTELRTINGAVKLVTNAPEEIKSLRSAAPIYSATNKTVTAGGDNILANVAGEKLDIEATFTLGTAKSFGFNLRKGVAQKTVVRYDATAKKLIVDKTASGKVSNGISNITINPDNNKVTMRIIVDRGVIDVFGNNGEGAINSLFFPDPDSVGMELFAEDGSVTVDSIKIYSMKSAYHNDAETTAATNPENVYISTPNQVEKGDVFTVTSNVLPNSSTNKKVTWTVADSAKLQKVSQTDTSITLKALAKGDCKVTATTVAGNKSKEVTVKVSETTFESNLGKWTAVTGTWAKAETGYTVAKLDGSDSFTFSSFNTKVVNDYKVNLKMNDGGVCGLTFGAANPTDPKSARWYGALVDLIGGKLKLFSNNLGSEEWNVQVDLTSAEKALREFTIKVNVTEDGLVKVYLNDRLAITKQLTGYVGGTLGLLTWNSAAIYKSANVTLEKVAVVTANPASSQVNLGTKVALSCATPDALINYSTDNGTTWKTYTGAISLTSLPMNIKAYAVKDNFEDSIISTFSYTAKPVIKNGWIKASNGKKYYYINNVLKKDYWVIASKSATYRTDSNGAMVTGFKIVSNKKYYFGSTGVLLKGTGFKKIGSKSYYLKSNVILCNKKVKDGKSWYITDKNGAKVTGTTMVKLGSKRYCVSKSGALVIKNWFKYKKHYYYTTSSGSVYTKKTATIKGKKYKFTKSGICKNK